MRHQRASQIPKFSIIILLFFTGYIPGLFSSNYCNVCTSGMSLQLNSTKLSESPVSSGLIDTNFPENEFNIISTGNSSENLKIKPYSDFNTIFDQISLYNYWNFETLKSSVLYLSNLNLSYLEVIQSIEAFQVNTSLISPFVLMNINPNESTNLLFNFQHLGFQIYSEENSIYFNSLTIIPDIIENEFQNKFYPDKQDFEVLFTISDNKVKVSYINPILFWQSTPPITSINLLPTLNKDAIFPFTYGINTSIITLFDYITVEFNIFENKASDSIEIENSVTLGKLKYLIIAESLPEEENWDNSSEISLDPIIINFESPLVDLSIDLPNFSIYGQSDIAKRLQLESKRFFLYSIDALSGFSSFDSNEDSSKMVRKIDSKEISNIGETKIESGISYQIEKLSPNKVETLNYSTLTYDRKNFDLSTSNQSLYYTKSNFINESYLSKGLLSTFYSYMRMYQKFLSNYSNENNFTIPENFYDEINVDAVIETDLSFWDGSELTYYHGITLEYNQVLDSKSSAIDTIQFNFFGFLFGFIGILCIYPIINKRMKKE